MIIVLTKKASAEEFKQAREVYDDYIKTVIDIEMNILAAGGEFHIDCEEVLLKLGCKQENLYGGGYRISTNTIEYMAMSNIKPSLGKTTYEIADPEIQKKLEEITKLFLLP